MQTFNDFENQMKEHLKNPLLVSNPIYSPHRGLNITHSNAETLWHETKTRQANALRALGAHTPAGQRYSPTYTPNYSSGSSFGSMVREVLGMCLLIGVLFVISAFV